MNTLKNSKMKTLNILLLAGLLASCKETYTVKVIATGENLEIESQSATYLAGDTVQVIEDVEYSKKGLVYRPNFLRFTSTDTSIYVNDQWDNTYSACCYKAVVINTNSTF